MFTGLIETSGAVTRIEPRGPGVRISISAPEDMVAELTLGESVAVDGACLTVVSTTGNTFAVEASSETMKVTTLGDRAVGHPVHLERALRVGDRLGGHMVSGHVDATGRVRSKTPLGESLTVAFDVPPKILKYVIPKGSIAIDGISLTVNGVDERGFDVVLIPHTQEIVRLHLKSAGDRVNLEADLIGKYVERMLVWSSSESDSAGDNLSVDLLTRSGFIK